MVLKIPQEKITSLSVALTTISRPYHEAKVSTKIQKKRQILIKQKQSKQPIKINLKKNK